MGAPSQWERATKPLRQNDMRFSAAASLMTPVVYGASLNPPWMTMPSAVLSWLFPKVTEAMVVAADNEARKAH